MDVYRLCNREAFNAGGTYHPKFVLSYLDLYFFLLNIINFRPYECLHGFFQQFSI